MPFPRQEKHEFSYSGITGIKSKQSGVYGILSNTYCSYIGQAVDIRESLLLYFCGQTSESACIFSHDLTYWLEMVDAKSQLSYLRRILLMEFMPVCN